MLFHPPTSPHLNRSGEGEKVDRWVWGGWDCQDARPCGSPLALGLPVDTVPVVKEYITPPELEKLVSVQAQCAPLQVPLRIKSIYCEKT